MRYAQEFTAGEAALYIHATNGPVAEGDTALYLECLPAPAITTIACCQLPIA